MIFNGRPVIGIDQKSVLSDEEAMREFQTGDERGFEVLLSRHSPGVLRFIMKMTGADITRSQDLLQEIFLKVIERRKKYERGRKFTTWLYSIARNHCIDFLRTESYRRHRSLDAPVWNESEKGAVVLDIVKSKERSQDERVFDHEVRGLINSGLEGLKDDLREVFILREMEGMALEEIAMITDSPLGTVKSRLRYAYQNLRKVFAESGFFEERRSAKEV